MRVELKEIDKNFGPLQANAGIHLTVPAGTIFGILGENGAGKSTLMKILSGFIQADRGEIRLDGRAATIHSPADAIRQGIGMLHQDPLDFPPMRVIDNFMIGSRESILPNRARVMRSFLDLAAQFDFSLDAEAYVDSLTVGERQQLEILRLLWLGARVLILDEPTTGISALQKEKLFATLQRLAGQGKTVIFVSHKLDEVEQICQQVAILRQGRLVGVAQPPYHPGMLVEMMFGKEISAGERMQFEPGELVLQLRDFAIEDGRLAIKGIHFQARSGEVIGLAGMEGSGQALFLRACAGLIRPVGGKVLIKDQDMTGKSYHAFQGRGVAYLPASRLEEGLIPGLTLTEHFLLSQDEAGALIDWKKGEALANERIEDFNIRGRPDSPVESLSGGNQQRALLALLNVPLSLLLMEHPTRGLDIESTIYIWKKLKERCQLGGAILFISSDLDEILRYSDWVRVFFNGRISPPLPAGDTTANQLGQWIGGKGWPKEPQ
jgi:simple sugar transport system ATP-binding protein